MKRLLQHGVKAAARLLSRYPANEKVCAIRGALLQEGAGATSSGTGQPIRIAIQLVEDPFYFALFGAFVSELRKSRSVLGELVVIRATSGAIGTGWRAWLLRSVPMTWILSTQWVRAYAGLVDRVGFRSHTWRQPIQGFADWFRSVRQWRQACRKRGDFTMNVLGVEVGDLISDTYLRFRPSPRFDVADAFVLRLIWQSYRAIRQAQSYFRRRAPRFYLTSYSTYVEHGVPVRVALQEGVRVVSFGSLNRVSKELTLQDWHHAVNCDHYRAAFFALEDQQHKLQVSEKGLLARLRGGIDPATSYMKLSAYANSGTELPHDFKDAVVVFLHDFYDSPHIYPDIVFGDFWEWTCFTIETLVDAGISFFLKPHPNQVELSGAALDDLKTKYPDCRFIPQGATTTQLVDAGMSCGVTVYGTIAHELAYLGVPSIGCARHPHISFQFCHTARNRSEYAALLRTSQTLQRNAETDRAQALAFYYMHNLHGIGRELALRANFIALWKACQDSSASAEAVVAALSTLRRSEEYAALVSDTAKD
jgi:hypothetical protein